MLLRQCGATQRSSGVASKSRLQPLRRSCVGDPCPRQRCLLRAKRSYVGCHATLGGHADFERDIQQYQEIVTNLDRDLPADFRLGPRNLEQEAPAFVQAEQPEGFHVFDDSPLTGAFIAFPFFFDPTGAIKHQLNDWLDSCHEKMLSRDKAPLYINGLTKSGKSAALNALLPAVIRNHSVFGVGRPKELLIFRLDMTRLKYTEGYSSMLQQFLCKLRTWCALVGVVLDKKLHKAVEAACQHDAPISNTDLEDLILRLLRGIKTPTIMLIDKLQHWFCPLQPGTNVEDPGSRARRFWKTLTLNGDHNILWAVTGSGMALVYANLNLMPTAGTAVLSCHRKVSLPAAYSDADLARFAEQLWGYLPTTRRPSAAELVEGSAKSVAIMAQAADEWPGEKFSTNFPEYSAQYMYEKLLPESIDDWSPLLTSNDRDILLGLSDYTVGVELEALASGLAKHLVDYVENVEGVPRHVRLASQFHRLVMPVAINSDGKLQTTFSDYVFTSDLDLAEDYLLLLRLAKLISKGLAQNFKPPYRPLEAVLQEWADQLLVQHTDHHTWHKLHWFQLVLESEHNNFSHSPTAGQFLKALKHMSEVEVLGWYHKMLRNCLSHSRTLPWKDASVASVLNMTQDDVSFVKGWPFAASGSLKKVLVSQLQSIEISIHGNRSGSLLPNSSHSASTSSGGRKRRRGSKKSTTSKAGDIEYGGPFGARLMRIGLPARVR